MRFLCSVFFLCAFWCAHVHTSNKPEILWATNDSPPFHILSGPLQGQGFCDVLIAELSKQLPEYSHNQAVFPHARITQMRQNQAPLCFACMILKPDTLETVYSQQTHSYQPHKLIYRPELQEQLYLLFGERPRFADILAEPSLSFGQAPSRKFGAQLQPILTPYLIQSHVKTLNTSQEAFGVMDMVQRGRVDYTIDYAVVGRYYELVTVVSCVTSGADAGRDCQK